LLEQLERREVPALAVTPLASAAGATNLANMLAGAGVTINDVTFTGHIGTNQTKGGNSSSAGSFTGGGSIIGFESGVVLSTGGVKNVIGPNSNAGISQDNNLAGDADLTTLAGGDTEDATFLEFDFIPTSDTVVLQYVFASEEYLEFVETGFTDVFGLFVNGVNVAKVPNSSTAVSINSINDATNSEYFVNNDNGSFDTEMDGRTVVLFTIQIAVNPNVENDIKLAIADRGDAQFDSNVFLRAGSFISIPSTVVMPTTVSGDSYVFEDPTPSTGTEFTTYDPAIAVGYNFVVRSGPNFAKIKLPTGIGNNLYTLHLDTNANTPGIQPGPSVATLTGGVEFDFTVTTGSYTGVPAGLASFQIMGIEPSASIDPDNPGAFAVDLNFISATAVEFTMTPIEATSGTGNSFIDQNGDKVSVKLTGGGTVTVVLDDADGNGQGNIAKILVNNTTASSKLSVSVKKAGGGDGKTVIGAIEGSQLKSISAAKADLNGAGIDLSGALGSLSLANILNGADIKATSLGKTVIKGKVDGSTITVTNSVTSFKVGNFLNSQLFVGYTPTTAADPMGGGVFTAGTIGSFKTTGIKNSLDKSFFNSTIAAKQVGTVTLASVKTDNTANSGTDFGVIGEAITRVKVKDPKFTFPGDNANQDFRVDDVND